MIISIFKKLIGKSNSQKAEETRIEKIMADFKAHPMPWDDAKMGKETEAHDRILNKLLHAIPVKVPQNKPNYIKTWTVAASLILIAGLGWYTIENKKAMQHSNDSANTIVIKSGNNKIRKITLSDSSVVWLNVNSAISYPDHFNGNKRSVVLLEGEAFFDIKHDDHKPFQVRAGKTLTNVLGTAFNISSYASHKTISVTVARGKVAVNNNILLPNDQLAYTKATGKSEMKKLQSAQVIAWMQERLAFNDESLKAVAEILENKYNVKIHFDNKQIAEAHFTGRFEASDDLYDILDALTMTRGLSYEAKGAVITITNNQTN